MATIDWDADPTPLLRATPATRLAGIDTRSTPGFDGDKDEGVELLAAYAGDLAHLQERLWAESRAGGTRSVLLVLQGMDTSGKGGIVRHVAGAFDPQGVSVHGFKAPTPEEREHDFLWRIRRQLPAPGKVGVFDRSHYEDVLIHRVRSLSTPEVIQERYGLINQFERELVASGTSVIKVMLHISADEQKERLAERLDRSDKHWKYNPGDVDERMLWPAYQEAYELAVQRTTTNVAPWFIVPADRKWYARLAVQRLVFDTLTSLDPQWPVADFDVEHEKARLAAS